MEFVDKIEYFDGLFESGQDFEYLRLKYEEFIINDYFKPVIRYCFNQNADIQSIVVAVAQYYSDNAMDEVHLEFLNLSSQYTTWENIFNYNNKFYNSYKLLNNHYDFDRAVFDLKNINVTYREIFCRCFEQYCIEGCHQDMDYQERYTPIFIATKTINDINLTDLRKLRAFE